MNLSFIGRVVDIRWSDLPTITLELSGSIHPTDLSAYRYLAYWMDKHAALECRLDEPVETAQGQPEMQE